VSSPSLHFQGSDQLTCTDRYSKGDPQKAPANMLVSEIGSLSLEFTRLSQLTGDPKYYDAIQRISNELELAQNSTQLPGLWPVSINAEIPSFAEDNFFTLGGMSDSLYEYLPKQYLLHSGLLSQPRNLYEKFIDVAKTTLFFRIYNPENKNLTVSGDIRVQNQGTKLNLHPRGQHLTCFTGGMVALGSRIFSRPQDLEVAEELAQGCMWAYDSNANGIAPELFTVMPCPKNYPCTWDEKVWHDKLMETYYPSNEPKSEQEIEKHVKSIVEGRRFPPGFTSIDDRRYILRPEAIESVFILYRVTGKQIYADAAWRMFQAVESVSRTPVAAAAIRDITIPPLKSGKGIVTEGANQGVGNNDQAAENDGTGIEDEKTDSMESFWLAETLKYFYLCFEEWDVVSLDDWVLNTEAHPLRRPGR
jgi:mannosyl-oligosaccharide alpha-1,2-mannosidase